jgi:hypothetical protein
MTNIYEIAQSDNITADTEAQSDQATNIQI